MKTKFLISLIALSFGHISAMGTPDVATTKESLAAQTCGDTSLVTTYYAGRDNSFGAHILITMATMVRYQNEPANAAVNRPSFLAWSSSGQPNTVPIWQMNNPTTTDVVYLTASAGTTPSLKGFQAIKIVAYVYTTQICGSVPLYSIAGPGDHWFTTDLTELNELIATPGWTDSGIVAYVLPLAGCPCTS